MSSGYGLMGEVSICKTVTLECVTLRHSGDCPLVNKGGEGNFNHVGGCAHCVLYLTVS